MPENYNDYLKNTDDTSKQGTEQVSPVSGGQTPVINPKPVSYPHNNNIYSNTNNSADTVFSAPYQSPDSNQSGYSGVSWNTENKTAQYDSPSITNPYTVAQHNKPKKEKSKGMSKAFVALMLVVCILISSGVGFGAALLYFKNAEKNTNKSDDKLVINTVDIDEQTADKMVDKSTAQISEEVSDTVVEITTETMSTSMFYGQYVSQGAGSGVIISSDGYIVTNNHVIEGATSITVTLKDKRTFDAKLIGTDSVIDIALLKIDAKDLNAAVFGDSDKLKVGDKAVAIGNPLGQLGGTVTDGIISALDRDVVIGDETMHLLQTDTAINPGNSGGGLFDGQGTLVGIVVAKSAGSEIEGLGFAVPINDVIDVVDDLKNHGYVTGRPVIGVELMDITNPMYAMYYYGSDESGCFVNGVVSGSGAEKAGISVGDRIVAVNGKEIETAADVEKAVENKKVGDVIELKIERNGNERVIKVTLSEYVPEKTEDKR